MHKIDHFPHLEAGPGAARLALDFNPATRQLEKLWWLHAARRRRQGQPALTLAQFKRWAGLP